jgi:hypothetical protein
MTAIPAYISTTERDAAEADLARHARSINPTSLVQDRSADSRVSRPGRSATPRRAPTRPGGRRTAVMGPPRRATWIGGLPRTRTPCRGPIVDRTTRRTRPASAGIPDPRTAGQRNADALPEVRGLARAAQDCPSTAGEPPQLTGTIDRDALRTRLGVATLDYGTQISAAQARR